MPMKQMIHHRSVAMVAALLILGVGGCGKAPDERLAEFAQQSMSEQRKQNDRIAEQSQAVVVESHQLATDKTLKQRQQQVEITQ
jgi:hypothetical protein